MAHWLAHRSDIVVIVAAALLLFIFVPIHRQMHSQPPSNDDASHNVSDGILQLSVTTSYPNSYAVEDMALSTENVTRLFEEFVVLYNRSYRHDTQSIGYRVAFRAFKASLLRVRRLNAAAESHAQYGVTRFSDLTRRQFVSRHLSPRSARITAKSSLQHRRRRRVLGAPRSMTLSQAAADLPRRVDWRERGCVSSVRDQGQCGACWAFSCVETLESMWALHTGNLTTLSAQELIDCTRGNMGCLGGDICITLDWIQAHSVMPAFKYPLNLHDNKCRLREKVDVGVRAASYQCGSAAGDEQLLLKLLAWHGPLAAAVDATNWQDYQGGVISHKCAANVNHAVELVGYRLDAPVPHYIVRNSWGTSFGQQGYLLIAIGHNMCGITEEVGVIDV